MRINFRTQSRAPDELGGVKIPYLKLRRGTGRKVAWYIIVLAVLAPILYLGAGVLRGWLTLSADGLVTLGEQHVRATNSGVVTRLTVRPGEVIQHGAVLVVIDNFKLDAAAARNAVGTHAARAAQTRLTKLERAQRTQLHAREAALRYLRKRRAAVAQLLRAGAATTAELDAAATAVSNATAAVAHAQMEIAADTPATNATAIERQLIKRQIGALTQRAPFTGRVLHVPISLGEYVTVGQPLMTVARLAHPRIVAYVPPRIAAHLSLGSSATVRFPDGTRLRAVVDAIPQLAKRLPSAMVNQFGLRPVTVVLDLTPQARWPRRERIQNLPVSVRFHYRWESTEPGKFIGTLLERL